MTVTIGSPLSSSARKVLLCGAGELGKEVVIELQRLGVEVIAGIDVTSDDSVASLVKTLGGRRLDRLINNAGILERNSLEDLDWASIERQFRVNAIGPLRVTQALLDNLGQGSKVFIITSRMGSIDDNTSGSSYGYRMSKAAVNMAGKSLSVDLQEAGIANYIFMRFHNKLHG